MFSDRFQRSDDGYNRRRTQSRLRLSEQVFRNVGKFP